MALSKEKSSSIKFFMMVSSILVFTLYFWMNFYIVYSQRLPGNFYVFKKKNATFNSFYVNMDSLFPKKNNNIDSLMKGLNWLENHEDLKNALEKKGLDKKFF